MTNTENKVLGIIKWSYLTRFNNIAIRGTPQTAVDKEGSYSYITILNVSCPYNSEDKSMWELTAPVYVYIKTTC